MNSLYRGTFAGAIAGVVLVCLVVADLAGSLQEPLTSLLIILMVIGSPFLPGGSSPGPIIVPRFGQGADLFGFIAFVALSAGIGWGSVFVWTTLSRHGLWAVGWVVASWLVALGTYGGALWLDHREPSSSGEHWIRLEFRNPVDIQSIMFELTALSSRSPNIISDVDPTTTRSLNPHRPQEVALDIVYADHDGRKRVDKQPSIMLSGFRAYYPLDKPLEGVVGLTLVFPGPSMIEVSEIEVMGTAP